MINKKITLFFLVCFSVSMHASDYYFRSILPDITPTWGECAFKPPADAKSRSTISTFMHSHIVLSLMKFKHTKKDEINVYPVGFDVRVVDCAYRLAQYKVLPVVKRLAIHGLIAPLPFGTEVKKILSQTTDIALEASLQGLLYGQRAAASSAIGMTGLAAFCKALPPLLMQCGVDEDICYESQMLNDYIDISYKWKVGPRLQPVIEQMLFKEKPKIHSYGPSKIADMLGMKPNNYISVALSDENQIANH